MFTDLGNGLVSFINVPCDIALSGQTRKKA